MLSQTLKSRWFVVLVHAGLWLLLYFAASKTGGKAPLLHETEGPSPSPQSPAPVGKLAALFTPGVFESSFASTNGLDPFYTRHFVPSPAPAPPTPTTRKISLVYLGYYTAGDSLKQAIFKEGPVFLTAPVGSPVATNFFIADASPLAMTLTNTSGQTTVIQLNKTGQIEVPIK